jgi:hypothetical protein
MHDVHYPLAVQDAMTAMPLVVAIMEQASVFSNIPNGE